MKAALLIALTLLPLAGFSQSNNGLVAHWLFTGNAFDSTGNGHNGTMNNVTFTTGRAGNVNTAVRFNGSDTSHITAPYTSDLNLVNYSLCALVKPEGFYTNT